MATPLYNTDIIPLTSRPTLTVMDDVDYFAILDTSTGKISKILKTNIMTALKITYDNTSGLIADTVQAALDELVVNLGSSDSAISALDGRLDTLEGTGAGSVADDIAKYAVKLTKMPNGATAVYSQDVWETADGWTGGYSPTITFSDGVIRVTSTSVTTEIFKTIVGGANKTILLRIRASKAMTLVMSPVVVGTEWQIVKVLQGNTNFIDLRFNLIASGDWFEIDWIWIGDYSYLDNTLATEASRIANQLGDTTGVGTKASGTIASNGTNVSDGDTVTIAGKVYTFKTVLGTTEGNVLIGDSAATTLDNIKLAINSTGVTAEQYCAAIHPLVEATTNTDTVQTLVARRTGILGNQITLAKSAATLTVSGATLSGGTDDVGEKLRTQIASLNGRWITPTFANSWVAFDATRTAKYSKDSVGTVRIKGIVKSGTVTAAIFTLPTGFKPAEERVFPIASNGAFGIVTITAAGVVTCTVGNNTYVSLDGINFKAEA